MTVLIRMVVVMMMVVVVIMMMMITPGLFVPGPPS